MKLSDAEVKRSGATSKYVNHETNNVDVEGRAGALKLRFNIKSKGGGTTELYVSIGPKDFDTIASALSMANRSAATLSMAKELSKQISLQSSYDTKIRKAAFEEFTNQARKKYEAAASDTEDLDYLVLQKVKKISAELTDGKA
ncbi:hypothetical protein LB577_22975 [Mesorhizobium sp. B283B1A]|uniref:hypothetical protein n=1 Tax=Mesorhizobium TaxID=68287 RepID=UPI001CD132A7|nr:MULTISPECIES: hypothetical protein [Mesorhizobium]MCA0049777.1 hypothetical protein [Mesorhizobium sp. B283B1A]UQS64952.1 hypothetical protein M5D98_00805 [Mesorhizobium opportunistum]